MLPSFSLPAANESDFDTIAVTTTARTTIAGPPVGPAQTYEVHALHGVAKGVDF
ncbi:MAG: hypothetical protein ACR2LK_14165 [Solirubrobacteraceae bacterium]